MVWFFSLLSPRWVLAPALRAQAPGWAARPGHHVEISQALSGSGRASSPTCCCLGLEPAASEAVTAGRGGWRERVTSALGTGTTVGPRRPRGAGR